MRFNKKYFMRCPCKEEREFMFDIFKKYQLEKNTDVVVLEWGYNNMGNYDETPSHYGIGVKAKGLTDMAGKPIAEDFGVHYLIQKKKISAYMKEKGIIKPNFPKARFIRHKN